MNILIGIAILLTLMLSDTVVAPTAQFDIAPKLFGLLLFMAIPPLCAIIQVFMAQRQRSIDGSFEQQLALTRRNSTVHVAIWIISSLTIVCVVRWQDVVRLYLGTNSLILVDEVLIVLPMLVSLIVSWSIFFDQHAPSIDSAQRRQARFEYVKLRCNVYLIVILIPVAFLIFVKDLWPYFENISPALTGLVVVVSIAVLLCMMPVIVSKMWSNRSISDDEGRRPLLKLCDEHEMSVTDIRIWDTGHQIVNALVAGLIPRFRVLMVSDLLIESFPSHELKAVLRHEAGHIRLRHLPIRIGFILLPALAMVAIELDPNQSLRNFFEQPTFHEFALNPSILLGLLFFGYVLAVTAWLSKNMEFEADLYAIGALQIGALKTGCCEPESPSPAQSMSDALLRFAEQNPDQFSKRSLTHPSLFDRIEMIKTAHLNPKTAEKFRRQFTLIQFLLAFGILFCTIGLIVI